MVSPQTSAQLNTGVCDYCACKVVTTPDNLEKICVGFFWLKCSEVTSVTELSTAKPRGCSASWRTVCSSDMQMVPKYSERRFMKVCLSKLVLNEAIPRNFTKAHWQSKSIPALGLFAVLTQYACCVLTAA
ncbi:hypothetical protein RRG08_007456 [Elysia crispata]|uniref:Uncharacterized protein n=1 Tax=Elysia crispata TaxID=231223 RepID=A0AAE1CJI1_9GAST|nr:hypothetical protein RRG08_007456 [Elysia crispata]